LIGLSVTVRTPLDHFIRHRRRRLRVEPRQPSSPTMIAEFGSPSAVKA